MKNALDGKQPTIIGAATTITSSDLTTGRVLISNSSGKVAVSSITSTKLGYLSDVTSNIQVQINNKADSSDLANYVPFDNTGEDITISADSINFYTDGGTSNAVTINSAAVVTEGSNPTFDTTITFSSGNNITNETDPMTGDDVLLLDAAKVSTSVVDASQYIVDTGVGLIDSGFSDPTTSADSLRMTDGSENNTIAISPTNIYINTDTLNNAKAYYNGEEIASKTWTASQGYITGIDSSDVTEALGYIPQKKLTAGSNIIIAEGPTTWTQPLNVRALGGATYTLGCNGTMIVALTNGGYVSTSTNGTTWTQSTQVANLGSNSWVSVSSDGTNFVALGQTGYVSTSTNGTTWTEAIQVANLGSNSWAAIGFDGTKFVALGQTGYVSTSTDGTTWTEATQVSALGSNNWRALSFDGTKFVALGQSGNIATSTDGTTWTSYGANSNLSGKSWNTITYDGMYFVTISMSDGYTSVSEDGVSWSVPVQNEIISSKSWRSAVFDGTKFVVVSADAYVTTALSSAQVTISAVIPDEALSDLTDVTFSSLSNGQYLTYNSTSQKWENTTASFTTSLSGLTDVALSSLVDGQVLSYNSNTQKWVNGNALKNTATGSNALTILGNASSQSGAVNIGYGSNGTGQNGVAIGQYASASNATTVAIGSGASASGSSAIQIGTGTNSTANTLSIGLGNNNNYQLLDATGLIPDARISSNIARSADLTTIVMRDWSVA